MWQPVIGIETHVQLLTDSKLFSSAATKYSDIPNAHSCEIDAGLPGTLPKLNRKAIELAIRFGIAVGGKINTLSEFARKHYYYPDLPKGYQISQYENPIISGGGIAIKSNGSEKIINLTRAHLEEDAGKLLHEGYGDCSGVDLNRAGTPLLEIVSEPELYSPEDAVTYAKNLHKLVKYIGICNGNLQEGAMRFDVNISIKPSDSVTLGTRCEIKNLNSFKFLEQALHYEIKRHIERLEAGEEIKMETLLFEPSTGKTKSMRSKESEHDYRYFHDPDLLPVSISNKWIESINKEMPELPWDKKNRFQCQYKLSEYDANLLTADQDVADYYEDVVDILKGEEKMVANWVSVELGALLNKSEGSIRNCKVSPKMLGDLLSHIMNGRISGKMAKEILEEMWDSGDNAEKIITDKGFSQITDIEKLEKIVNEIISQHPAQVREYKSGKSKLIGFFIGQVMKETKGQANPKQLNEIVLAKLQSK